MDVQGLKNEAQSAIASASTLAELDDARVRYLGRKSALKQALREVRDPESGRVLNTLREQLEREVAEREAALSGQDLERRLYGTVTRYSASAFTRMKLGQTLSRSAAPHIFETAEDAKAFLAAQGA